MAPSRRESEALLEQPGFVESVRRYVFLDQAGAGDCIDVMESRVHLATAYEVEPKKDDKKPKMWIDISASVASFAVTAVIYVSTAQSVVGKLDPRLIYVVVDMAFLGSALSGLYLTLRSKLPWAVGGMDVGFAPLLAQMATLCWDGCVNTPLSKDPFPYKWTWAQDGPEMYDHVSGNDRRAFVATFVAASSLMFLCCGVVLALTGWLKLTRVVEYLPYPVTAGMLASIGVSLLKSGVRVAAFGGWRHNDALGVLLLGLAALTAVVMRFLKRKAPPFVAAPLVLIAGTLSVRLYMWIWRLDANDAHDKGLLFKWDVSMLANARCWFAWTDINSVGQPSSDTIEDKPSLPILRRALLCLSRTSDQDKCTLQWLFKRRLLDRGLKAFVTKINWSVVFECRGVAAAAVVIGVIKIAMKTGSLGALFPLIGIDVDDEIFRIGVVGNVVPSLFLASGQAYSFTSLKLAQQLGASEKGAGVQTALLCLLTWALGFGGLQIIPRFVYGAILLDIGWDYVNTYVYTPIARKDVQGADAATALAVVFVAVATSLLEAIAVGVVLCLLGTASKLAGESVIASVHSAKTLRSTIERTPRQGATLDDFGDAIKILSLRGYLFFGSASELLDAVRDALTQEPVAVKTKYLVIDVAQCFGNVDATAVAAFNQIAALASHRGYRVSIAPASRANILAVKVDDSAVIFESADDALEQAEDAVLTAVHPPTPQVTRKSFRLRARANATRMQSKLQNLLAGWLKAAVLDASDAPPDHFLKMYDALVDYLIDKEYVANEIVYMRGDDRDDAFLLVCAGRLRLLAPPDDHCVRKLSPGNAVSVGEFYLAPENRKPTRGHTLVAIVSPTVLLRLPYDGLLSLEQRDPECALAFHKLMASSLSIKNRNSLLAYREAT